MAEIDTRERKGNGALRRKLVSTLDASGRTIWLADAHRSEGKRYVVHAEEKLTAFLELERDVCIHLLTERANDLDCINPIC